MSIWKLFQATLWMFVQRNTSLNVYIYNRQVLHMDLQSHWNFMGFQHRGFPPTKANHKEIPMINPPNSWDLAVFWREQPNNLTSCCCITTNSRSRFLLKSNDEKNHQGAFQAKITSLPWTICISLHHVGWHSLSKLHCTQPYPCQNSPRNKQM